MPKRSIYLQPPNNSNRRIRRDLEFLCNYWDRLLASNQSYDIRLPELLRANHLMRHLSSLSSNHGLRVNVSFTILDDNDCLGPQDINPETYQLDNTSPYHNELRNNGFYQSPYNINTARYNDFLRNCARQMSKNYAAIERELTRARLLAPLVERDRIPGCQNAFYNQRAATYNWNKFPVGSRASSAKVPSGLKERHFHTRERSNHPACASFQHECCIADKNGCSKNQQPRQKEQLFEELNDSPKTAKQHCLQNSPQISFFSATLPKLQSNNNALQNCAGTVLDRNNNITIKQQSSKESMEACQGVSKIISDATKTSHSGSSDVKPNRDDVAINKSDKRSNDLQSVSCQGNVLQTVESSVLTDQRRHAEGQVRDSKRKLEDLENRRANGSQQDRSRIIERIKPRVKDVPTIFSVDEKATRSRTRNSRMPMEGRPSLRRHVCSPKYASFLRMTRKEETDEQLHGNSSSRRDDGEKLQRRRGLSTESTEYDNQMIHDSSRIEKRTPTPRSTVHTTYNPIMHSSTTDPLLDSSGLTIQLLRLAVLLYAPTLMPALNSLIAQQNQQTTVSMPSSFEGSNDLLTQVFRLLNEQHSILNLPFVSIESDRTSSALTREPNTGKTNTEKARSEDEKEEPTSSSNQESTSVGASIWKSNNHVQKENKKDKNWRLTSIPTNSGVRLDRNIFKAEDFWKFEEFLRVEQKRPEDVRSLSTKGKNEVVMKEYFRDWLHQLLQQMNATSHNLSSDQEAGCPEGSSRITGESSLEEIEEQRSTNRLTSNESPDSSKDEENIITEHEEDDSDDQKSFTSATSTNSSRSVQFKFKDNK